MDKQNEKVRKYICQRAELIGAIRLPNNTFKDNAGTVVTSDIIFLKKRDKITDIEDEWVHLDKNQDGIEMNSYFVKHPEMILGTIILAFVETVNSFLSTYSFKYNYLLLFRNSSNFL